MDLFVRLLTRMAYWVRRPPSRTHVMIFAGVIVLAVVCFAVEALWGWPDWLTAHRPPRSLDFTPMQGK